MAASTGQKGLGYRKYASALVVVGLVAILAGAGVFLVLNEFNWYARGLISGGLLLLVLYTWIVPDAFQGIWSGRSLRYGSNSIAMTLAVLGILVLANYLVIRHPQQWDLTAGQQYTLSDQTLNLLAKLDTPIEVTGFFVERDTRKQEVANLLQEYGAHTSKLNVTYVDPDVQPGLAEQYGIRTSGTIVFDTGAKRQSTTGTSESDITSALFKVISGEPKKVYFLTGHGERSPDDAQQSGYSTIKKTLEDNNYSVGALNLATEGKVPDDASVLIVATPTKPLLDSEQKAIGEYLDRKGKLFLLTDPDVSDVVASLVDRWGVTFVPGVVVDTRSSLQNDVASPVFTGYNWSPVTKDLKQMTVFPGMVGVKLPDKPASADVQEIPLMMTSEESWSETDKRVARFDQGADTMGPLVGAATIETAPQADPQASSNAALQSRGRVVIVGDSDFVTNAAAQMLGNTDFFVNSVNWLAEDEGMLSISARATQDRSVVLTATQSNFVIYSSVIFLPLAVIILGAVVWWRRR